MRVHFQNVQKVCSAFLCPIFFWGLGDLCAGQELKTGGDAPVTGYSVLQGDFQPVLKGPGAAEQDLLTAEHLFLLGRVFEAEKRERQAIQCYERACQYVSSDAVLISLVSLAVQQKRYDEAFRYFDQISDPSLLGLPVLDRLVSCAARLDENERVVRTYRALLETVPVNEAGPLRMLIHDRLGWAEYQAGNLDRALVSLRAVHMMLKESQRYGIREEELVLFKDSREVNLLLLLDVCITKELADEAETLLGELMQLYEQKLAAGELSEEEAQGQRDELRSLQAFESARIAYVRKEAERALKLALEAYELGHEEEGEPFALLEAILRTLGREEEMLTFLENIQKKRPDSTALKARIAQEYAYLAIEAEDTESGEKAEKKSIGGKDAKKRAFAIYRELWSTDLERYALDTMVLAAHLGEREHFEEAFWRLLRNSEVDFGPTLLLEDLCGQFLQLLEEREKRYAGSGAEELKSAESAESASTESASTESASTESASTESASAESASAESASAESASAESASAETASTESASADADQTGAKETERAADLDDAVERALQDESFVRFADQLFTAALQEIEKEEETAPDGASESRQRRSSQNFLWAKYGFLAVAAHRMERSELALMFCSLAAAELERTKITSKNREYIIQFVLEICAVLEGEDALELAEQCYRTLRSRIPGEMRFSVAHAYSLLMLGRFEEAESLIQTLLERDPDDLEFIFLKANWLRQTQRYEEARILLRKLLDELQTNFSAEFNRRAVSMIRNMTAVVEERLGNREAAEELIRSILDEFPDDASAKNSLAYLWACENRRLARALQYSRESLKAEPGNPMYLDTLGWIYYRLGEFETAYETLKEAAKDLDDPVVFSHLGDTALALGQKEEAIQYFEEAMKQFKEAQQKNQDLDPKDLKHVEAQLKILKNS